MLLLRVWHFWYKIEEIRNRIGEWKNFAVADCALSTEISEKATQLMTIGLHQKDAAHIACAIHLNADCFLTTDRQERC